MARTMLALGAREDLLPKPSRRPLDDCRYSPDGVSGKRRVALVLWNGDVGGAEVLAVALARRMRQLGVEVTLVFIEDPRPLVERLVGQETPYLCLGFDRGRDVLRHPRRYAAGVRRAGPDGALLVTCGFMGAALRAGGYDGPIVAVEHGDILEARFQSLPHRALRWAGRIGGALADDLEVAVSDFILERLRRQPHARGLRRIYNGIETDRYATESGEDALGEDRCVIAFAGRLVYGKGPDYLIQALAQISATQRGVCLRIAGDGPERLRLESLAAQLGIDHEVEFVGLTHDMPQFWQTCDIAVVPSAEFIESCPLTPLEAMATGKPVIATQNGGLPELIVHDQTGMLVAPNDAGALADALVTYVNDRDLRLAHGAAGQSRVNEYFHIDGCARAYLELFDELAEARVR